MTKTDKPDHDSGRWAPLRRVCGVLGGASVLSIAGDPMMATVLITLCALTTILPRTSRSYQLRRQLRTQIGTLSVEGAEECYSFVLWLGVASTSIVLAAGLALAPPVPSPRFASAFVVALSVVTFYGYSTDRIERILSRDSAFVAPYFRETVIGRQLRINVVVFSAPRDGQRGLADDLFAPNGLTVWPLLIIVAAVGSGVLSLARVNPEQTVRSAPAAAERLFKDWTHISRSSGSSGTTTTTAQSTTTTTSQTPPTTSVTTSPSTTEPPTAQVDCGGSPLSELESLLPVADARAAWTVMSQVGVNATGCPGPVPEHIGNFTYLPLRLDNAVSQYAVAISETGAATLIDPTLRHIRPVLAVSTLIEISGMFANAPVSDTTQRLSFMYLLRYVGGSCSLLLRTDPQATFVHVPNAVSILAIDTLLPQDLLAIRPIGPTQYSITDFTIEGQIASSQLVTYNTRTGEAATNGLTVSGTAPCPSISSLRQSYPAGP